MPRAEMSFSALEVHLKNIRIFAGHPGRVRGGAGPGCSRRRKKIPELIADHASSNKWQRKGLDPNSKH